MSDRLNARLKEEAVGSGANGGNPVDQKPNENQLAEQKPANTNPQGGGEQKPPVENKVEYNDEGVLSYLRESRGIKDANSLDDIFNKQPEPLKFASEDVARLNKYTEETGRGLQDFIKMNRDLNEVSDLDILKEDYSRQGYSDDDIKIAFDLDLQPYSEEDGYTPEEVSRRNREIEKRDLRIKQEAKSARERQIALKDKFSQPIEGYQTPDSKMEQGRENWKNEIASIVDNFDLGIEGYKHEANSNDLIERYSSVEKVLDQFRGQDGKFNHSELIRSLEIARNFDNIKKVISQNSANAAIEKQIRDMERPGETQKPDPNSNVSAEDQKFRNRLRNY